MNNPFHSSAIPARPIAGRIRLIIGVACLKQGLSDIILGLWACLIAEPIAWLYGKLWGDLDYSERLTRRFVFWCLIVVLWVGAVVLWVVVKGVPNGQGL